MKKNICYIVLVNYKGWKDTIECLESLLKMDNQNFRVIVCDNDSGDHSLDNIESWAKGKIKASYSEMADIKKLVFPFSPKPVDYSRIDDKHISGYVADHKIILIQNCKNGGFAYGNNIGIKLAMAQPDCRYLWCLNNDTVVIGNCLDELEKVMDNDDTIGICGTMTRYYYSPDRIQCEGGYKLNKWTFKNRRLTKEELKNNKFDYINGASMFINPQFIRDIGYMNEEYFLYCEEPDWSFRNHGKYKLVYAPDAVIFHKEGASTGGNNAAKNEKSYVSDFYSIRSRIRLARNYYHWGIGIVYFLLFGAIIHRFQRKQYSRIWMILKLMANPDREIDEI